MGADTGNPGLARCIITVFCRNVPADLPGLGLRAVPVVVVRRATCLHDVLAYRDTVMGRHNLACAVQGSMCVCTARGIKRVTLEESSEI